MRRFVAALALAALVAACSDQPTAVDESAASLRAAQGDRSEWTVIPAGSTPEEYAYEWGYVPCMNGGQGEAVVTWGGPYGIYVKIVSLPSGVQIHQGEFRIEEGGRDWYRGLESQEVWYAEPGDLVNTHFVWKYFPDGYSYEVWGTLLETLTSVQTGKRIRMRSVQHYSLLWDATNETYIALRADNKITACRHLD